ncbi:hypothetical protein [Bdellovibrio sp. NC01]|uniref:hypothetical protein n=1 Tax=Bdellovibrio sp. NC01 TaxID=2220073 RepID=UPI001157A0BB|nr:hypothetical protein [Bdellovibrio sp. NC01]QDK36557.1 hypothetical protein DOE51_02555 [Bdellovibrio sp. NC01]
MKSLILASLLIGSSAFADTTLFNCVVPAQTPSVKATVVLADDQSADFVTLTVVEKKGTSTFFFQGDKGSVTEQVKAGSLQFLAMTEQSAQGADGVIVNTGLFSINADQKGAFSGLLLAKGNIYPLSCSK